MAEDDLTEYRLKKLEEEVKELKKNAVTKEYFKPTQMIVHGMVAAVLMAVLAAVLATVGVSK